MNPRQTAHPRNPAWIGLFLGILTLATASPRAAEAKTEGIPSRDAILRRMETIFGPLPGTERRVTLDPEVLSETDCGSFVRRDITYRSEPGSRVPAFLLIPKTALRSGTPLRHPAALALHQTHAAGRRVVVGLGNSPDDEYGVELAQRGWVVLAPAYPQLADYAPDILGLGHASGSMKAVWDNVRGLDLLASLPFVRTNGFASIGHSLGGHNGLFTAAFDSRIRVVVTSCGFDSFRDYRGANPDLWRAGQGWCQVRYMPRLAAYQNRLDQIPFDFPDVLAAIAPRRVFVNAPTGDTNFKWDSVDRVVRTATGIAQVSGEWVTVRHPEAPHQFPSALRQEAYRILEETLGKAP
jgi:hypothetical protein